MRLWLHVASILLGAVSVFSLVQKLAHFGLVPIFHDLIAFYRAFVNPIVHLAVTTFQYIGIDFPEKYGDIIVLELLLFGSLLRSAHSLQAYKNVDLDYDYNSRFVAHGVVGLIILFATPIFVKIFHVDENNQLVVFAVAFVVVLLAPLLAIIIQFGLFLVVAPIILILFLISIIIQIILELRNFPNTNIVGIIEKSVKVKERSDEKKPTPILDPKETKVLFLNIRWAIEIGMIISAFLVIFATNAYFSS